MPKARRNEYQFNVKHTSAEYDKVQAVNQKYFQGQLTNTELGRFLIAVALDALEKSKVEVSQQTVQIIKVNGKVVDVPA